MRKICVVLTARTSYTKIKPILVAFKKDKSIDLQIVLAASALLDKYGNTDKMVTEDDFKINEKVFMTIESESLLNSAKSTGLGIIEFSGVFNRLKPDLVLVMADRFEVISAAISAAYQNIPLGHIQGGEVSGNIDEKVRHAITKLADFHQLKGLWNGLLKWVKTQIGYFLRDVHRQILQKEYLKIQN